MSPRWRRRWIAWHLTLGVLLAPYALVYGVSSLLMSHPAWAPTRIQTWTQRIEVPPAASPELRAIAARDALELIGSVPTWRVVAEADGTLRFRVARPGRVYDVAWDPTTGEAAVHLRDRGLPGIVAGLHGLYGLPGSQWGLLWGAYTHLSLAGFPFLILSGLLLDGSSWGRRPASAWLTLVALLAVCALAGWLTF